MEAAANSLFGVFTDSDPEEDSPKGMAGLTKVETIRFGIFDTELWHLYLDARILIGLMKRLDGDSVRKSRIILTLNNCINVFSDDRENVSKARDCLKQELAKPASASDLNVSAIGHAHIDTGWLWPLERQFVKPHEPLPPN